MPFKKSTVDFSKTHILPKITEDYIQSPQSFDSYINAVPEIGAFKNIIEKRKASLANRSLLATVLKEQNASASPASLKNIESLKNENSFTVTTGHQLNILTGPLYFIYKIITTIKLSQILNEKYPRFHFVPVYWMNGEDHDIEEINHTYIYGKKVEWNTDQKGATGRMTCKGMAAVIDEVETLTGTNEQTEKILSLLKSAYKESNTLCEATRMLVNTFFGKYGLVIIDADDARFKKEFIPVIKDDLFNNTSYKQVNETIAELKIKYEPQVHPREINLFYLNGVRERIVKENAQWTVLNTSVEWTQDALMKEVEEHPERFSPNVVLRPLYQEFLLPNVAFVGGPAEIAYWLEYKKMFDHYKVNYPTLIMRQCSMIVDDSSSARVLKLGLREEQLFNTMDDLIKDYITRSTDGLDSVGEMQQISNAFDAIVNKISKIDVSLRGAAEAEKQRITNGLKALEEKAIRAQKKKHETVTQQIQKLKDKFYPDGVLQERHDNFIPFFIKYGESFFDELLANSNPPEREFLILTETK